VHERNWETLILNFAIDDGNDLCVVEFIEYSGVTERAVHELRHGAAGSAVGSVLGTITRTKRNRSNLDTCMPTGWTPRA